MIKFLFRKVKGCGAKRRVIADQMKKPRPTTAATVMILAIRIYRAPGKMAERFAVILLVPPGERAHIRGMTTTTRPGGLCGWSIWCASVAISLAFCASAFAGANSGVSPQKKV